MANTTVQSEQIEDGSITADKLADGTIVAAELADNAVVTAAINADAVTGAKIADNAINSEHYTDGSIDTAHIADAQITVGKMAANSVDSDQYVDGSIDTVHIADLQVTTAKIANGNISTAKIADNAVTSAKIDTNIDIAGTFDVTGATTLDSTLAVAGDANFDSGTLFVDVSANKVGVGTTSPAQTLHTSGTGVQRIQVDATDNNAAGAGLYMKVLNSGSLVGNATVRVDNVGNIDFFNGTSSESQKAELSVGGDFTLNTAGKRYYVPRASDAAATGSLYSPSDSDIRLSGAGSSAGELQFEPSSGSGVAMTINSSGYVGIGVTSVSSGLVGKTLQVGYGQMSSDHTSYNYNTNFTNNAYQSGNGTYAAITSRGAGIIKIQDDVFTYSNASSGSAGSNLSLSERMRIESTGDIRFGIANAALTAGEVHTFYNVSRGNNLALYTQGADQHFSIDMWNHTGGSCNQVQFRGGGSGAVTGTITSTGNNATQYNTSSDYRLKENVDYTWDATSRLKQLKPVRFNWIDDDTNTLEDGFLAHEVSSVVPNAVRGEKDDVYTEEEASDDLHINAGDVKRQQLDHSKLVPLLVKTIQEQQTIIEAQTTSINDLKTRIEALES